MPSDSGPRISAASHRRAQRSVGGVVRSQPNGGERCRARWCWPGLGTDGAPRFSETQWGSLPPVLWWSATPGRESTRHPLSPLLGAPVGRGSTYQQALVLGMGRSAQAGATEPVALPGGRAVARLLPRRPGGRLRCRQEHLGRDQLRRQPGGLVRSAPGGCRGGRGRPGGRERCLRPPRPDRRDAPAPPAAHRGRQHRPRRRSPGGVPAGGVAHDVPCHAVVFPVATALARQRNAAAANPLPAKVLDGQLRRIRQVVPGLDAEGFAAVHTVENAEVEHAAVVAPIAPRCRHRRRPAAEPADRPAVRPAAVQLLRRSTGHRRRGGGHRRSG